MPNALPPALQLHTDMKVSFTAPDLNLQTHVPPGSVRGAGVCVLILSRAAPALSQENSPTWRAIPK